MIKIGLIGAGKMGLSHLAILGAHPDVEIVGVCDTSKMILDALNKYGSFKGFSDYKKMIDRTDPDAVFVAVPTKLHANIVQYLLKKNIHVFSEKPFCLTVEEGEPLVALATEKGLVTQVGYHNKFVGTFNEAKNIISRGYIGELLHFTGEAYGPVVVRRKQNNWRADPGQGGGCLMDYASHVIDLIHAILGPIKAIKGTIAKSLYSKNVEDAVYSLLRLSSGVSGVLSVNWSDETYRKMSTSLTVIGSKGKIICDASELKVYFKDAHIPETYTNGWNVKYVTDFTPPTNFYLRGEEYSCQVDYFIEAIQKKVPNNINNFQSAWETDQAISLIRNSINN